MRRVRVGVIGLGEVAQVIHLPILESLADRYRLTAVCDVSPTLLKALGERYAVPEGARHADFHELVARDDVDAVLVLTVDEYHAECSIAAAKHGKHVLVEKPMCLAISEAEAIIRARDEAGVQVMVAYMRRFAPAFTQAVEEVKKLDKINYVRVRDIIGRNRLIIDQSSTVIRPDDYPAEAIDDRAERAKRLVQEALGGEVTPELNRAYRLLLGLNSHDLSAMRELIGYPKRVLAATQWNGANFLHAIFDYGDFQAVLETGVDEQVLFDAHIEVLGPSKYLMIRYDTPYIRHLPTTLVVRETNGEQFTESVVRPTYKDPYTHELEYFHEVVTTGKAPKTTPEDFVEDLRLDREIIDAIRSGATSLF